MPFSLSVGTNTITLAPCPSGFFIKPTYAPSSNEYTPTHYVYIAGTGTPEAARAVRISGYAGDASCQFSVTLLNAHGAGYTVGSASGGIKEASEAARAWTGWGTMGGHVIIDGAGSPYKAYAPIHIESSNQVVDYGGGSIYCYMATANGWKDDDCMVVGQRESQNTTVNVTLNNLVFHAANGNTVNYGFDAINVNAQKTSIRAPVLTQSATGYLDPANIPVGSFNSLVSVCDDEAFSLDGIGQGTASCGLRTDRRGQLIYAFPQGDHTHGNVNNCYAVGWLSHLDTSMQCGGNGVTWLSGNGLGVSDSVLQGFSQYGLRAGTAYGGYNGNVEMHNTYFEAGPCLNPDYVSAGAAGYAANALAGVIMQGGTIDAHGSTGMTGAMPQFACSGSAGVNTQYNYWVIPNLIGGSGYGSPLYIGNTPMNCSGTLTGYFPALASYGGGTMHYDIIRSTGVGGAMVSPYRGGCPGGSATACGSVIVGKSLGGGAVESFTDDTGVATAAYTVNDTNARPTMAFWPGNLILAPQTNSGRSYAPGSVFVGEQNLSGGTGQGVINPDGYSAPSSFSLMGSPLLNGSTGSLGGQLDVHLGGYNTATLLFRSAGAYLESANTKGRLNFPTPLTGSFMGPIITLVDSNFSKTAASRNYRPGMDAADVWIGTDVSGGTSVIGYADGSPVSISHYINVIPDGVSWKERLTANLKAFTVPLQAAGGSANKAICWKPDGKTLGFCSTQPDATGSCTCN